LKISEEVNDIVSSVLASAWFGIALASNCEFEKASYYMEKAIKINAAANALWGVVAVKSHLSLLVYNCQGKVNLGFKGSDEAVRLAEKGGDLYSRAMAYTSLGASYFFRRSLEEAIKNLFMGANLCERANILLWYAEAHSLLGDTYFEIGEYQKSKEHYAQAIETLEQNVLVPSNINWNKLALARVKAMNKEMDIDLESFYAYSFGNKVKNLNGRMANYIGEILLDIDNGHGIAAEDWIKKAIEADRQNGMMWNLGQNYALYAKFFKRKGDLFKTKENLGKAIEILKECGADGWVSKYEKELASIL
jgi:tetratricopeptide (TPR) repeat protein